MLPRLSVKKPYTVVVAVVLVIILGVVSFTKMSTDLFPSMNLPYAIVMTSYQGASPETVETAVTKPVEQSMATVSNIENVSSVSGESMSLVILEFAETANMDSATIEMRENLDQLGSFWDDSVGKPVIMKLNPDMMPIMVAAVDVKGLEGPQVTDYVDKNISPELESIAGVASVSATGTVTESVDVIIRQEKLDQVNQRVQSAVGNSFTEKEQDLTEAQEDLESGREELESGKEQLESGKQEMAGQMGSGDAQLSEQQGEAIKGETELDSQMAQLEDKQRELDSSRQQLQEGRQSLEDGAAQLETAKSGLSSLEKGLEGFDTGLASIDAGLETLQGKMAALDPKTAEGAQMLAALQIEQKKLEEQKAGLEEQRAGLQQQLDSLLAGLGQADIGNAKVYLEEQLQSIEESRADLDEKEAMLEQGQAQLNSGKAQLEEAKSQIAAGKVQLSEALSQLSTKKILASIEMSVNQSKLESADKDMEAAQEQIDSGREQLQDAKEQALEKADLKDIVTSELVQGILAGENFSMPAGYVTEEGIDYLVRVGDKAKESKELGDLVILDMDLEGLEPIRLSEVADISEKDNSSEVYAKLNGNPGVLLTLEKQTGYSTGDVTDKILERFSQLQEENADIGVSVLMNQGIYIDMVVNSVLQNMIYGAILAILVLFLFLKDIRPTFVIACSIPISVVTALVLMYFSGVTLNVISLSGLALGIGMLVDNSIVVIENIYRMRSMGIPAKKAAIEGARQVSGAIAASTLTTVCVFAPIVFTEGITRQLFVDMGLTIAYSLAASLVVALTLVPMMSAGLLRYTKAKESKGLDRVRNIYGRLLANVLRYKAPVLILSLALLVLCAIGALKKGTAFMPEMESTQTSMTITTDKGTPFQETAAVADQVVGKIEDIDDIETIGAMAGQGGMLSSMGGGDNNTVTVYLVLKENKKLSGEELKKEILKRTAGMDCQVEVETSSMDMSALGGSGINLMIKGRELDDLQKIATDVGKLVSGVKGTEGVSDGMEDTDAEFRISVDKAKAMEHQLTVAQVFQELNDRLAEAKAATTLSTPEKDLSVYVRKDTDEEISREDIKNMTITVKNQEGEEEKIKIGDIAVFTDAVSPQSIRRDGQSRYMSVTAQVGSGYNIGLLSSEIQKKLDAYELPPGYSIEMSGEDETINDAMGQLMLMLVLAIVFMYLIMVAQFQSLLSPFIIMFTIPLAFTGGFMGLLAANKEVSVIAVIGFVMLSGIIVNNGIVLVDYINQLRREGMGKRQAIVEAGRERLRPIIMTALTTILGLSTMAMGMGMGGDMVQPMAIVTIGGLLYGTLLTLFIVPCIYDLLNRKDYQKEDTGEGNRL